VGDSQMFFRFGQRNRLRSRRCGENEGHGIS
jgi:hypothetical protein